MHNPKICCTFATLSLKPKGTYPVMTEHHEIETRLAYSEKLRGLAVGHQQETKQLLENIEELQDLVRQLRDENKDLRDANEAKDARIAELEQRVADLEKTTFHFDGDYIEAMNIEKYMAIKPKGRSRQKMKYYDLTNQLPLWTNQEPSI